MWDYFVQLLTRSPATGFMQLMFILALILRIAIVLSFGSTETSVQFEHGSIARNMAAGYGFAMHWPYAANDPERKALQEQPPSYEGAFVPPLGPAIIFALILLVGDGPAAALLLMLINALIASLQPIIIYRMTLLMSTWREARIAALFSALFLPTAYAVATFSGSALYQTLALTMLYAIFIVIRRPTWRSFALLGFIAGALTLFRSEIVAFGLVMIGLAFWLSRAGGKPQNPILLLTAALVPFTVLTAPWLLRNHQLFDEWIGMSSHPWNEVWRGTNAMATGSSFGADGESMWIGHGPWEHLADRLDSLPYNQRFELAADSVIRDEVFAFVRSAPWHASFLFFKKILMLWTFDYYAPQTRNPVFLAFMIVLLLSFYCGFIVFGIRAFRSRRYSHFVVYLLYYGMYTALFALTHVEIRYQLYILSSSFPIAAIGMLKFLSLVNIRSKRQPDGG